MSCTDAGIGTGFLLSDRLVLTVEHVIHQAAAITLVTGDQRTTGRVVGSDPTNDLALVRSDEPIDGYHFRLRTSPAGIGDDVAAIGFPIGDPITFTRGNVSGLDRTVSFEDGTTRTGLLETDAAINPGNSGGPLITEDGDVAGLVDAKNTAASGIGYAVPASLAAADLQTWQPATPTAIQVPCSDPLGPGQTQIDTPSIPSLRADAAEGIAEAFGTYFGGINSGDYRAAYDVLSPRHHSASGYQTFADGDSTSYDSDIAVLDAQQLTSATARVALSFVSIQAAAKGPNGDTCDVWTLDYTMIEDASGAWLIDAVAPYGGRPEHVAC